MVQVVLSLPVLSSDDDSDQEVGQSSGDETKESQRASPPIATDGGVAQPPNSKEGGMSKDGGSASEGDSQGRLPSTPLPQGQEVLFTTTDFYLVLRMHHLLAERLAEAKKLCREAGLSRQTVVASPQEVGGWVGPDSMASRYDAPDSHVPFVGLGRRQFPSDANPKSWYAVM